MRINKRRIYGYHPQSVNELVKSLKLEFAEQKQRLQAELNLILERNKELLQVSNELRHKLEMLSNDRNAFNGKKKVLAAPIKEKSPESMIKPPSSLETSIG